MNGFVPTQAAFVQGPDISGLTGGVGQRRAQEQQQKSMLSTLMGIDMNGMSEQGIKFSQKQRDYLIDSLTNGNEDFTYEDFTRQVIGLQDFIVRDKKTYAENLAVAQPILNASINDATYSAWKAELEKAGKYMSQEAVQQYAENFDRILENPYPGDFFNPSDMMLFAADPALAARGMMPAAGSNILGVDVPDQNAFQYELEDLPTGDVFAYMKSGAESNLLALLNNVDNEADAKQKIAQHYKTFVLGVGPGRRALQESFAGQSYFIKDLAENLVDFEGVDPSGMAEHLIGKGNPLGRQFESNNESFYKEFEEYYMDLFRAKQRDAAADATKGSQKDPKYQFEANLVKVPTSPEPNTLAINLMDSDMYNVLPKDVTGLPDRQEEAALVQTISQNGFMRFDDGDDITIMSEPGSGEPDFMANSFGVGGYGGSRFLVLSGTKNTPVYQETSIEPEPGVEFTKIGEGFDATYRVKVDDIDAPMMNGIPFMDDKSLSFFESVGSKYLKSVDITKVDFGQADQATFNTQLGMAIVIRKMASAIDSNGERIFSDQEVLEAQQIINQAKIKF